MPAFVVGPVIARAMTADGVKPATDETHVLGSRAAVQWSLALADDGTEYRWVRATDQVYRYRSGEPTSDVLHTRFGIAPPELAAAIRAAFPAPHWIDAAEIAFQESRWNARALADTVSTRGPCGTRYQLADGQWATTEYSRGYFQINGCAHPAWNS